MKKLSLLIAVILPVFFSSCTERKDINEISPESISKKDNIDFENLLFVGMINENPGLFLYDIDKKEYKPFWSNKKEKVVELSYSGDWKYTYFLTASKFGFTGSLPFINKVKLYIINTENKKITLIEELGSGLQVFTRWEDNSTVSIIFNSFDKTVPNYINRNVRLYNIFGKKLNDETRTFDIIKEGYPQAPPVSRNFVSPNGKLSLVKSETDSSVYLRTGEGGEIFIVNTEQLLDRIEWSGDIVAFSTIDDTISRLTGIYVYSLSEKRLLNKWINEARRDFYVINNLLFFDNFKEAPFITVYDINNENELDQIKIKNGCGLRSMTGN